MRIVQRIINGETDRRMVLENGFISRQLEWGSDWNNLVVGIRSGFLLAKDEIITDNPRFFIGITAGTGSVFEISGSSVITSSNAIGAYYGGGSATQLGYSSQSNASGSYVYAWQPNNCLLLLQRQGTTNQTVVMQQSQTQMYGEGSRNGEFITRIPIFFEFERTGSMIRGEICCPVNSPFGANSDTNLETFAAAMSGSFANIPTLLAGKGYALYQSAPLAVTESTYGFLDSLNIYWNQGAYAAWEISDVAVSVKS